MKNSFNQSYVSPLHALESDEWLEELRLEAQRARGSKPAGGFRQRRAARKTSRPPSAPAATLPVLPFAYDFGPAKCNCPTAGPPAPGSSPPEADGAEAAPDAELTPYGLFSKLSSAVYPTPAQPGSIELHNILRAMAKKGYVVYSEPFKLNIVGIRNPNPLPNSFDDKIICFYKDDAGNWVFHKLTATTDPGRHYLAQPMNPKGTAILVPGQYLNSHKLGLHKGQYTALVQQNPVTVVRDSNKDDRLDFDGPTRDTGLFGINLHRATASGTSKTVDRWSAGCQVFASSSDFAQFISWCQRHSTLHGNNFTYTLLKQEDLS